MSTATTLSLGERLPAVGERRGADGRQYTLASFREEEMLVVVFVGNGCPTVRLYEQRLLEIHHRLHERGMQIVLVNSNNDSLSPPDPYERMVERANRSGLPFPYLKDGDGTLARACGAICTPHAFVFDRDRRLRYRGRIDDSRTGQRVTTHDLESALADLLADHPVGVPETEPFGCAIVW